MTLSKKDKVKNRKGEKADKGSDLNNNEENGGRPRLSAPWWSEVSLGCLSGARVLSALNCRAPTPYHPRARSFRARFLGVWRLFFPNQRVEVSQRTLRAA